MKREWQIIAGQRQGCWLGDEVAIPGPGCRGGTPGVADREACRCRSPAGVEALLIVLPSGDYGGYGEGSQKDLTVPVMEEGGSTQMPGLC